MIDTLLDEMINVYSIFPFSLPHSPCRVVSIRCSNLLDMNTHQTTPHTSHPFELTVKTTYIHAAKTGAYEKENINSKDIRRSITPYIIITMSEFRNGNNMRKKMNEKRRKSQGK